MGVPQTFSVEVPVVAEDLPPENEAACFLNSASRDSGGRWCPWGLRGLGLLGFIGFTVRVWGFRVLGI